MLVGFVTAEPQRELLQSFLSVIMCWVLFWVNEMAKITLSSCSMLICTCARARAHMHTHMKIQEREEVRENDKEGYEVAVCPGPVGGIGLGPQWPQGQGW